jgi:uncharacterized sulfatase
MGRNDSRPNILIYCTDQQRADLMGCMGHAGIRTPNLDALAARGVLLRNLFIQGPVCMPSRASIMTGRYPSSHGVTDNGYELPRSERTIAHALREAGYFTAVVGRTHVRCSIPHPVLPERDYYGFERCHHSQCYWTGLDPHGEYLQWMRREHPDRFEEAATPRPVDRDDAICASWTTLEDDKTMTAWVTARSLELLREHRQGGDGRPFLLWAGTWDPHSRFLVPAPWDRMYPPDSVPLPVQYGGVPAGMPPHFARCARKPTGRGGLAPEQVIRNTLSIYWGMISHVDDQFGRLMRGLDALGLAEDTVVLFLSDHGEMAGDHGLWAKGPYFFDAALRVPGIVAAPGRLPAGRRCDALVETVDLLPALLEMAGAPAPPEVQGRSCLDLLAGRTERHRDDVFTEYHDHDLSGERMFGLRMEEWRITCYQDRPYGELYDLRADPQQTLNLWDRAAHEEVRRAMQLRLLNRLMSHCARPDRRVARW